MLIFGHESGLATGEAAMQAALSHYRILEQIGAGGMGVVYRAHDEHLDCDVALKVLPPGKLTDEAARKRFRKEALALSKVNHPNIAVVHDFDTQDGTDFLVEELIPGFSLSEMLISGPLPERDIVNLGSQLAEGLQAAHQQGVIHRDLKPANIRVTPDVRLKILDFGLARIVRPSSPTALTASETQIPSFAGTLSYMAPEQLLAEKVDSRTDIWAVGCVLYEMATGRHPFAKVGGPQLIGAILHQAPMLPSQLNPKVSAELERIINKCLEKDPEKRYQSAKELAVDLRRLGAPSTTLAPVQKSRGQRKRRLYGAAVGLALLIAIVAGVLAMHMRHAPAKHHTILIADFEDHTREDGFDETIRELLNASMEQSHFVTVFPRTRVPEVLRLMERSPNERITERVALEICQREGLDAVLLGSIRQLANTYVFTARAVNANGRDLVSVSRKFSDPGLLPNELDAVVKQLRTGLGESLGEINRSSAPLAQVTSADLEAVRLYTHGRQQIYSGDPEEAVALLQQALQRDPDFAMAHEYLGVAYWHLNDLDRTEQQFHEAFLRANRVTEIERYKIIGDYSMIIRDYDRACATFKVLADLEPLDPGPFLNLAWCKESKFDYGGAIAATKEALRLQPAARPKLTLALEQYLSGDATSALSTADQILRELPDDLQAQRIAGVATLAMGRPEDARRLFDQLVRAGGDKEITGRAALADLDLATGKYRDAQSELEAGIVAAEKRGNRLGAVMGQLRLFDCLRAAGHNVPVPLLSPELASNPVLALLSGRVLARTQRLVEAEEMLRSLEGREKENPVPTITSFRYMLAAEIELARRSYEYAVAWAEKALHYENSPLALETLARAYAAAGRGQEAITAYEQLLRRSNERSESYDAPAFRAISDAHYRLALLYQQTQQHDQARIHLEAFLHSWSHPDPGLKIYSDAPSRLRELRADGTPTPAR